MKRIVPVLCAFVLAFAMPALAFAVGGNDGRVRGKIQVEDGRWTVRELLDRTGSIVYAHTV
ncbi:MAG: hypothetical protein IJJ32_03595 [Eggerthellaceae bacterium]|nr:hypothetical protein [Eggerthellaceae bacterium]